MNRFALAADWGLRTTKLCESGREAEPLAGPMQTAAYPLPVQPGREMPTTDETQPT